MAEWAGILAILNELGTAMLGVTSSCLTTVDNIGAHKREQVVECQEFVLMLHNLAAIIASTGEVP